MGELRVFTCDGLFCHERSEGMALPDDWVNLGLDGREEAGKVVEVTVPFVIRKE